MNVDFHYFVILIMKVAEVRPKGGSYFSSYARNINPLISPLPRNPQRSIEFTQP
jgi:hypothetical protein